MAVATGYAIYPAYPGYDPLYALIWGAEVADLELPSFDAYRAPTAHPLTIALGALLSPLGAGADRALLVINLGAYVALAAGVYRLARVTITPLAGWAAALLVLSASTSRSSRSAATWTSPTWRSSPGRLR
ncbi:MAG: hypothetical protein WKF31_06145 [Thermoleophilaceae bacterium]